MANGSDVNLLEPLRYARNDPRNRARVYAGHLLSMRMGGYDYPIRRLRRVGEVNCVTLPPQVRNSLELKGGEWLMFGEGPWPGCAWICKVTNSDYERLSPDKVQEFRRNARKVQGGRSGLYVTISPAVRKILSAEIGDFLSFSLPAEHGVISVSVTRGGDGSTGRQRSG
ncbi:hypothetical protein ES703_35101 [subsurface metagenome]